MKIPRSVSILGKIGLLSFWAVVIIYQYYVSGLHSESISSWFWTAIITILLTYGIYKGLTLKSYQGSTGVLSMIGWFFLELLILAICFMGGEGVVLFIKILWYSFLPASILLIASGVGHTVASKLDKDFHLKSTGYRVIIPVAIGFSLILGGLGILVCAQIFTIWSVGLFLVGLAGLSIRSIITILKNLFAYRIELGKESLSSYTLLSEGFFMILTLILSASLINIIRPMPIGWDDLGVYMNFPKMIAENGGLPNAGLMAWQSFTAIGFLFQSAPQAFFLNQLGGILSILFITFGIGSLLKQTSNQDPKKSFAPISLILATSFLALPMVVFEQAKDMKLDPGVFALSIAALFGIYELFIRKPAMSKGLLAEIGIIGFIAGTAFAVKFTTLMFFIGMVGLVAYEVLGLLGFFGFFGIFVGIFTKLELWGMMNVVYPKDNPTLLSWFGIGAMLIGLGLLAIAIFKTVKEHKKQWWISAGKITTIFIVCAGIPLISWSVKNIVEIKSEWKALTINGILNGYGKSYTVDYNSFRTDVQEIQAKKDAENTAAAKSGTTLNEDFGRYFGYESGINNHLKLPINLTTQANQAGEYTDISFVFLALLPVILIFIPFTNIGGTIGVLVWIGFFLAYYFIPGSSTYLTTLFGKISLPLGYIPLFVLTFLPLIWAHFTVKKSESGKLFLRNFAFITLYSFLFVIAAFGVVWYGIALYFGFFLSIAIALGDMNENSGDEDDLLEKMLMIGISITIIVVYLFRSAIPHAWTNISNSGFSAFKNGTISQNEAIFKYHSDYLEILGKLNLKNPNEVITRYVNTIQSTIFKKLLEANLDTNTASISTFEGLLENIENLDESKLTGISSSDILAMKTEANTIRKNLYSTILYPSESDKNLSPIYRIGTFLTYFISNNRTRYFDDSLVTEFYTYFYDENKDTTVDRIKKSGLKYFLVDLNAATIDQDPRHNLTTRYESLLSTFPAKGLKLVQTDSICLQVGLEDLANKTISESDYMVLSGVNYESYQKDASGNETKLYRSQKLAACQSYIVSLIKNGSVSATSHSFLLPLTQYITKNNITSDADIAKVVSSSVTAGWLALFEVTDEK